MFLKKKRKPELELLYKLDKEGIKNLTELEICELLEKGLITIDSCMSELNITSDMFISSLKNTRYWNFDPIIKSFHNNLTNDDACVIFEILTARFYSSGKNPNYYFDCITFYIFKYFFKNNNPLQNTILNLPKEEMLDFCENTNLCDLAFENTSFLKELLKITKKFKINILKYISKDVNLSEHLSELIVEYYPFEYIIDYIPDSIISNRYSDLQPYLLENLKTIKEYNLHTFCIINKYFYNIINGDKVEKFIKTLDGENGDFNKLEISTFNIWFCKKMVKCDSFNLFYVPTMHQNIDLCLNAFNNLTKEHLKDLTKLKTFFLQFPIVVIDNILSHYKNVQISAYEIDFNKKERKVILDILKEIEEIK